MICLFPVIHHRILCFLEWYVSMLHILYAVCIACCIHAGELGMLWAIRLDGTLPTSSRYYIGHRDVNALVWLYMCFFSIALITEPLFLFKCGGIFGLFGDVDNVYTEWSRYISTHHFVLHSITDVASIYMNSFLTWLASQNHCAHKARLYLDIHTLDRS